MKGIKAKLKHSTSFTVIAKTGYVLVWQRILTGVVFLLIGSLPLHGQNPSSTQENHQQSLGPLSEAQSALKQGNAQEAVGILSSYLEKHPTDSRARTALGQAYAMEGQADRAEQEFQEVLKVAPDNFVALSALGEIYASRGQPDKAEGLLARAARASKGVPQIQMEWAFVLAQLHEYEKANVALSALAPPKDAGERIRFHRLKASVALGLGDTRKAASEMEKALTLKPDDPGLALATAAAELQHSNWPRAAALAEPVFDKTHDLSAGMIVLEAQLGSKKVLQPTLELLRSSSANSSQEMELRQRLAELLVSHGKFLESIDDFRKIAELDPSRGDLLFNLALAQFRAGRFEDALATAEKSKELGDTADLEDLMGDLQEARGDNLAAVKSYQAAVALAPNEERYRLSLAVELLRHKSFDATKIVLQQAEGLNPNSWRVQFALGMLEYFEGNEDEASQVLLRAAELSPEPPIALKYVGDIQMDRAAGPDAKVIAQLCKYADLHPAEATMQYSCGALEFRRDYAAENKAEMTNILNRLNSAAARLPGDASVHCQLGRAYRWLEQWQAALKESEACAKLDPDSAQSHYRLAQIYHHEGQAEKAKEEMILYEAASKRVADENARRDETMKTFLLTIQKETPDHK